MTTPMPDPAPFETRDLYLIAALQTLGFDAPRGKLTPDRLAVTFRYVATPELLAAVARYYGNACQLEARRYAYNIKGLKTHIANVRTAGGV